MSEKSLVSIPRTLYAFFMDEQLFVDKLLKLEQFCVRNQFTSQLLTTEEFKAVQQTIRQLVASPVEYFW